jgi:hypothetical protein
VACSLEKDSMQEVQDFQVSASMVTVCHELQLQKARKVMQYHFTDIHFCVLSAQTLTKYSN